MHRLALILSLLFVFTASASAQAIFTNQAVARIPGDPNYSGVAIGVADLNGDGRDDVFRLANNEQPTILLQQPDANFTVTALGSIFGDIDVWGLCIGDVDNDGFNDVSVGTSFNGTYLLRANNTGGTIAWASETMPPTTFQQGSNFVDMNNDGWVDHFGCDDVDLSVPSRNNGDGTFTEDYSLINPVSTVPSDNSGNYASIWTDYDDDGDADLYISKCRLGVTDPNDGRRLNQLFRNDGAAGFTDVAEAVGLLPRAQTWSTDFADIDNDGDMDAFILIHDQPSQLMINDGNNVFTDGSAAWGIADDITNASAYGIQCNFEDFDNDGYVDLMVTYTGDLSQLFLNNGAGGFSLLTGSALVNQASEQIFQSMASGDLNNDGYIDLYTGHASGFNNPSGTPDGLLINNGGSNNFLTVRPQGMGSNLSGIGAKIKIYGSWGVQTREIRSGEGYGISNSLTAHFGLGTDTEIDRLVIHWPSGLEEEILNVAANSRLVIPEGSLTATLPLSWQSINATPEDNKRVRIDWQTEQEVATSHFIVERRMENDWMMVGRTDAVNAAGNHDYVVHDNQPRAGENVYRIRQVDLTGAESMSPLAVAMLTESKSFDIYPNPASGIVSLRHTFGADRVFSLETLDGKTVRRFKGQELDLGEVPAGVYLVRSGEEVRKLVVH